MFGIANNVRAKVVRPCTPKEFYAAIDSHAVGSACAEIADALEQVKRGEMSREDFETFKATRKRMLPVITPHASFTKGLRRNDDAVPSWLSMFDIDHIPDPEGFYHSMVSGREGELGVVLAHKTPSTEGLRLVFAMPAGTSTPEEAQRWMARQLGLDTYDESTKDMARCSFLVPRDYIFYLDEEELFKERKGPEAEQPQVAGRIDGGNSVVQPEAGGIDGREASLPPELPQGKLPQGAVNVLPVASCEKGSLKESLLPENSDSPAENREAGMPPVRLTCGVGEKENAAKEAETAKEAEEAPTFRGTPYSAIIKEWFRLTGGEPERGERNDRLHQLASHLRYITDDDERLMLQIIPRYGLDEAEMQALIHSAVKATRYSCPRMMRRAVANTSITGETNNNYDEEDDENTPPAMPETLPPLIALLTSRTPEEYKPAVAHAVFPALGVHLHRTKFRYIDNVWHEATLMNVLMADTGAGKNCISEPINRIMADIRERDTINKQREREWKQEVTSKGANKDKRKRPEGLIIQWIQPDMTNPAFVMRMAEAEEHFLYCKMNEIEQFDALKNGRNNQQFQIICLSFDPDNTYGQTRVGTQSVTEDVCLRFNWNASTTIVQGKRYFSQVLINGPISRINFCTIPGREIGSPMPVYGIYDDDFDRQLQPYIRQLCNISGEVVCKEAFDLAGRLCEELAEKARLNQSRVYENLSFRANVIAYLKACVLYVANGCRWDETFEPFIRWSLDYDLWCKMEFFGAAIESANENLHAAESNRRGRKNLLLMLPDEFTTTDAVKLRLDMGMDQKGVSGMLKTWKNRQYIEEIEGDEDKRVTIVTNNNNFPGVSPCAGIKKNKRYRKLKFKRL